MNTKLHQIGSLLLCMVLSLCILSSSITMDAYAEENSTELERAGAYGISVGDITLDAPLTWQQFCGMLATALAKADGSASERFVQDAAAGMTRTDNMNRDAAMLACFYASTEVGLLSNYGEGFELYQTLGDAAYDEMAWDYKDAFPAWHEPAYASENPWDDHLTASYFYNLSYRSPLSEKRMFEYDEAANSLHLNQPITGEDGVCAIVRLMDGVVGISKYDVADHEDIIPEPSDNANACMNVADQTTYQSNALQFDYFTQNELRDAIALGLMDETTVLSGNISAEAFIALLEQSIALADGDSSILTSNLAATYDKEASVKRADAVLGFYWAAQAMGVDTHYANEAAKTGGNIWDDSSCHLFSLFDSSFYTDDYYEQTNSGLSCASWFVTSQGSRQSNRSIMRCDENGNLNKELPLTRLDAILGAYRLITSIEPQPEYVTVKEAAELPYDRSIITDELLASESSLPELSYANIPQYTGMCYLEKDSAYQRVGNGWFSEDAVRSAARAGINYLSVRFDFSTLNYPDYDSDKVNLVELKQLDRLISWGIQYGVHICIEGNGLINQGGYPRGLHRYDMNTQAEPLERLCNGDKALQKEFQDCWELLASRYASIPSKYLSFNLLVEISSPSEKVYLDTFLPIAKAIRTYNPDRVVFAYGNVGKVFAGLSAYGYPLAWSIFYPDIYTQISHQDEGRPVYENVWKDWFLNGSLGYDSDGPKSIAVNLEADVCAADFYINSASAYGWEPLYADFSNYSITAGGITLTDDQVTQADGWKQVSVTIPTGTKSIELSSQEGGGYISCDGIVLTQKDGTQIKIIPTTYDYPTASLPTATVTVAADGSVSSDVPMTFELLLAQDNLSQYLKIAQENKVGLLVAEWAPVQFSRTDTDALDYFTMMADGFRALGITADPSRSPGFSFSCLVHQADLPEDFSSNADRYVAVGDGSEYYVDTWETKALTGVPYTR